MSTFPANVPMFDPRVTPARPELAAKHLQGSVAAARFVAGELREVVGPIAMVRRAPSPDAPLDTEALKGERVTVYETTEEGWAWGQLESDGYVGWLAASALYICGPPPTHKVTALRTFVFPGPSIKLPPIEALPLGARVAVVRTEDSFAVTSASGYIHAPHLAPVATMESDFVSVAERFLGTPYLWGGKSALGIDCSGLVQVALNACGIASPRDCDMQERALGAPIEPSVANLRRGDLLFWPGHVAIAADITTILHANASHMSVARESTSAALARIAAAGAALRAVRRLSTAS